MTNRPRASLGRVLDDLGDTLLELVHGDADQPAELGGVVIHDPVDEPVLPRHALVLGVGLQDPAAITQLLRDLGRQQAVGLVVRSPIAADDTITAAVAESGVALLGLTRGASWDQLAVLLRSVLAEGDVGVAEPETLGGMPSGDLFALANAAAALLDAPVTIEDRSSRVLAFSNRQDEADTARVETVLGRQVPQRYSRLLNELGVFRELYRTDQPVHVPPLPISEGEFTIPRMAVAVRAGDEILGSIWVVVRTPLTEERTQALCDAAKLVALHMLRIRAGADVERRLRADLVSTALEGGSGAREALDRLGLADQPLVVLALSMLTPAHQREAATETDVHDAAQATERQRLADAFAMHLGAVHPRSAAALVGDVAYGLIPVRADRADGEENAVRIAKDFLDRIGDRVTATIGVGPVVRENSHLPHARAGADRALRVLRTNRGSQRVARLADVHVETLLLELRDLIEARGDQPTGPIARLISYDREHNSNLVETLRAWLDAFGDVIAAAASVYVHPNTFRYRLRRLAEVGVLDLDDPDTRFAAMLQLRVLPPARKR
ncbi:DNA-binding PucR family transcriptional regulator [Kribbella voronezhensis]|uniref:DNA-binding PucR family transcriptional regulator n=1 Tax=Kribbella voronezhensis TaxID=2512212 RepID=A0A4R7ST57_9ACTN|nr:helix-turn-helix domain-containing protein [Kribbella voronezhensis]TDU82361.1 DNA-binding PucR family transcriptional regulator [Kribbella voronezhensis]